MGETIDVFLVKQEPEFPENQIKTIPIEELEDFCEKEERVYWPRLSSRKEISEEFIEKFKDKVDWTLIFNHQNLSEKFLRKFEDKINLKENWKLICETQELSEQFIRDFENKIDFLTASEFQNLTESVIRDYSEQLDWEFISYNQVLSEELIEDFFPYVHWWGISNSQVLSEAFIEKHKEKLKMRRIEIYQDFSYSFARKMRMNVDNVLKNNNKLSEKNKKTYEKYKLFKSMFH